MISKSIGAAASTRSRTTATWAAAIATSTFPFRPGERSRKDGSRKTKASHEEKTLASILLSCHPTARKTIELSQLNAWLDHLVGWAEIDMLCGGVFRTDELLANWREWKRFILALSRDRNINKRRAALVFLTAPVRYSEDGRVADLGFRVIRVLQREREIIITKAISWLLRSMVRHHRRLVATYLKKNRSALPAVAVRETRRKIATGRK